LAGLVLANVSLADVRELEVRLARIEALVNAGLGVGSVVGELRGEVGRGG